MRLTGIACLTLALAGVLQAADSGAVGRDIHARYKDTIVTVRFVVRSETNEHESKAETIGTVIDPSGLTVISLVSIDPSSLRRNQMRTSQPGSPGDSEVKEIKLILPDNTEVASKVVLRDRDLDVAFVLPVEKPARPLPAVDLGKARIPGLLDEVVSLNRMDIVASRAVTASLARIEGVVERPRPFYLLGTGGFHGIGSPLFDISGAPIGFLLFRSAPSDGDLSSLSSYSRNLGSMRIMPVIIPAADILGSAKQVLEGSR